VRELFSGSSVIAGYTYDSYGNQTKVAGTGLDSDFGFAGYFYNGATGLNLTMNRVYNAQLGRWLTRDPIGNLNALARGVRFNATDWNLYAYCRNNPASCKDPLGLDGWQSGWTISVGGAAGGGFGYGGEVESGLYATLGGPGGFDIGLYVTTASGFTVGTFGAGIVFSAVQADQFFGEGAEIGYGPVGFQFNSENDITFNGLEVSVGPEVGVPVHAYTTNTSSVFSVADWGLPSFSGLNSAIRDLYGCPK